MLLRLKTLCSNPPNPSSTATAYCAIISKNKKTERSRSKRRVTAITSIVKKKADLSVGNIIGANIIDLSLILPLCTFINLGNGGGSLPVDAQSLTIDFPFCLAVAGFALIPALVFGKFKRWQGVILIAGYITYVVLLILNTTKVIEIF